MIAIYDYITGGCNIIGLQKSEYYQSAIEYDSEAKTLHVKRDKIGLQNVYYAQLPTSIVFADEVRLILPYLKCPQIRIHELIQPIRHNYPIDLKNTWIEQIKRLRAGEEAFVNKDGLRLHVFWERNHAPLFSGTKEQAIQEALRLMRQSVRRCIQTAEGPVVVLLSGGIDSTSLAAFAKENADLLENKKVNVLSAGYRGNGNKACDERAVARRFAQDYDLIYHEVELDANDFKQLLDDIVPWLDEPCFDVSCMSQMALYKKASEMGFKVILSGLGGDEQFYSYWRWQKFMKNMKLQKEFHELLPWKNNKKEYVRFLMKNWRFVLFAGYPVVLDESEPDNWVYKDFVPFVRSAKLMCGDVRYDLSKVDVKHVFPLDSDINSIYDYVFSTFMTQLCVYLGNKLTKANGISIRYPLLDADLVSFLDSVPLSFKFDAEHPKKFQKEIMAGILPDYILYARKRGFEPPLDFVRQMCDEYQYKHFESEHCFFNSMLADMMLDNSLKINENLLNLI